jgi:hypothetical protein
MEINYILVLEVLLIFIFILLVIKYYLNRKKKSDVVMAEIDKIDTVFVKNYQNYEAYLAISYHYFVKRKKYTGSCKIPFSLLLDNPISIELYFNQELDMPVLQINQEYIVGNEAIEHKLINIMPYIPVRYLTSDPSRNFVLPLNRKYGFFHKRIKKIS